MEEEQLARLALAFSEGVGARRFHVLVRHFGSARAVWNSSAAELMSVPNTRWKLAGDLPAGPAFAAARHHLEACNALGARIIHFDQDDYPPGLLHLYDPPPLLFVRGNLPSFDLPWVAVVGTRRASGYGREVAASLGAGLAGAGAVVISGMARGIDTCAHRGALEAGGWTVAVLGTGVDVGYPRENSGLLAEIAAQGAVISEFPPGSGPDGWHFPSRNRIVAALCRVVVVVEAGISSGALITTDLASDLGREIMAVPGRVGDRNAAGCLRLLKDGARLVEGAADVLDELGLGTAPPLPDPARELEPDSRKIYDLLDRDGVLPDVIARDSGLSVSRVAALLLDLELKGLASRLPGNLYAPRLRRTR